MVVGTNTDISTNMDIRTDIDMTPYSEKELYENFYWSDELEKGEGDWIEEVNIYTCVYANKCIYMLSL
jgi:hypothetical protein